MKKMFLERHCVHGFRNVQCFEWTLHPSLGIVESSNVGNECQVKRVNVE